MWCCQLHDYKEGTPYEKTHFLELWDVGGWSSHQSSRSVFYNPVHGMLQQFLNLLYSIVTFSVMAQSTFKAQLCTFSCYLVWCISRFSLGPGFVSQSDDVSLLVLYMPGVCYICGQFVSAVAEPQSAGRTTLQKPTTTLRRGHRAECWVPRQLCDTADNGGRAWGRKRPLLICLAVHNPRPTVNICSPDTRPSSKTTVAYVCASAGWLPGRVSGKGANVEYQLRWRWGLQPRPT